jgi:hypothetical protein
MSQRIGRQGGWVGLIVILLALAIVAWLSKDALKQYGMLGAPGKATEPTGIQRSPTPAAQTGPSNGTTSSAQAPMERARGVEDTVMRGAESQTRKIDESTR